MSNPDGGPAFPAQVHTGGVTYSQSQGKNVMDTTPATGMSLRDYFAAKAMQAAATNPTGADGFTFWQRAEWAYQQADAMLKAREA